MYRLIILFGICWALTDVHAADYEINLSVLNSLGQENIDQELPIPSIETPKTQKKTIERAAKKNNEKRLQKKRGKKRNSQEKNGERKFITTNCHHR